MIVQTVAAWEVDNVNFAVDLMEDRDLSVGEEASLPVISPYFVDESRLARVLQTYQAYEALTGQNVPDLVYTFYTLNPLENV